MLSVCGLEMFVFFCHKVLIEKCKLVNYQNISIFRAREWDWNRCQMFNITRYCWWNKILHGFHWWQFSRSIPCCSLQPTWQSSGISADRMAWPYQVVLPSKCFWSGHWWLHFVLATFIPGPCWPVGFTSSIVVCWCHVFVCLLQVGAILIELNIGSGKQHRAIVQGLNSLCDAHFQDIPQIIMVCKYLKNWITIFNSNSG